MQRLRLIDFRNSRGPASVGLCKTDVASCANAVNAAQLRLMGAREAGDEGWWGTWAEVVVLVDPLAPYITLPREFARLEKIDICKRPVPIQNQFFEYLQYTRGRRPGFNDAWWGGSVNVLSRNNAVTFRDLTVSTGILIRVYPFSADDVTADKRVFLQGIDTNGNIITSMDNGVLVQGIFLDLDSPFSTTTTQFAQITGIQKDQTIGSVSFYQVDPDTGTETLLLTMVATETTAWYRRYYLERRALCCCPCHVDGLVQVTAIAKLEYIPAQADTDYLIIQNLEALIEECQAVRYSTMDSVEAKQMEAIKHKKAIGLLQGELVHYLGKELPAMSFKPFGNDSLNRCGINIGMI